MHVDIALHYWCCLALFHSAPEVAQHLERAHKLTAEEARAFVAQAVKTALTQTPDLFRTRKESL